MIDFQQSLGQYSWLYLMNQYRISIMSSKKYRDYSLGARIRLQISNTISPFANKEQIFESQELHNLLVGVFNYELLRILSFGQKKFQSLRTAELVNYIAQQHLGENTISKFNTRHGYLCNGDKLMTKEQFTQTLQLGLQFLPNQTTQKEQEELGIVFGEIDTSNSGTISQNQYLLFLKQYFGSQSPMASSCLKLDVSVGQDLAASRKSERQPGSPTKFFSGQLFESKEMLTPLARSSYQASDVRQEFKQFLVAEITARCSEFDGNKDQSLTAAETSKFFYTVLELEQCSVDYILVNYFDFRVRETAPFLELVEVIGEVNFRELMTNSTKRECETDTIQHCLLNCDMFKKVLLQTCFFLKTKPSEQCLQNLFQELQKQSQLKHPALLALEDVRQYFMTYLCSDRAIFRQSLRKQTFRNLANIPGSIAEAQHSHFQQDSECNEMKPQQFSSSSLCQPYDEQKLLKDKVNSNLVQIYDKTDTEAKQDVWQKEKKEMVVEYTEKYQDLGKDNSISEENSQLTFSNVPRKRNSLQIKNQLHFKHKLWQSVRKVVQKYSKESTINRQQLISMFQQQQHFSRLGSRIKQQGESYCLRSEGMSHDVLVGYLIHSMGQRSLIDFSKKELKGKSSLKSEEVLTIMLSAYEGLVDNASVCCQLFLSKRIGRDAAGLLSYRAFLGLVGRELSHL